MSFSDLVAKDLAYVYAGDFSTPLVYAGQTTGCINRTQDVQAQLPPRLDLAVVQTMVAYATATLDPTPDIGASVTVGGVGYLVRHVENKEAGVTHLYVTATP